MTFVINSCTASSCIVHDECAGDLPQLSVWFLGLQPGLCGTPVTDGQVSSHLDLGLARDPAHLAVRVARTVPILLNRGSSLSPFQ